MLFLMKTIIVVGMVGLWVAGFGVGKARAEECRGLWVDAFGPGFMNAQEVRQLVEDCRQYNFNTVFVQMRRRGDAFYMPKCYGFNSHRTSSPSAVVAV